MSTHHNYLSPPQPWPPRKKPRIWPWVLGGVFTFVLLVGGCGAFIASVSSSIDTTAPTTVRSIVPAAPITFTTVAPRTTTEPPAPAGPATKIRKDGTYMVGSDILAGTWRATGGSLCYWARKSTLTGDLGSIIDNNLASGQQLVTILPGDKAFETQGCGTWELLPN